MQNSKAPARSALVAVFVNIVLNLTLIWFMGTAGLALSTAICSYLQVAFLVFVLRKTFSKPILAGLGGTFVKTLAATVFMFLVGAGIMRIMSNLSYDRWFNILRLAVVVPSAAVMYLIAAKFLNIEMLSLFLGRKGGDEPSA
jgi:putative peptidoglycan lipid II flippase